MQAPQVEAAEHSLRALEATLEPLVRSLTWRDFEILIDLIFRQAGWLRLSPVGATIKSIDLDLISPITSERYGVQVKSKATRRQFEEYKNDRLKDMQGFSRFYFAVHSPSQDLLEADLDDSTLHLLLPSEIARLTAQYGLSHWLIDKAR